MKGDIVQISIFYIALVLILIGVGLWAANTYLPMAQPIKTILNIVIVLLTVVWLLNIFGLLSATVTVPARR
jgi:hypothetical protein